jgi:hypothetical protein
MKTIVSIPRKCFIDKEQFANFRWATKINNLAGFHSSVFAPPSSFFNKTARMSQRCSPSGIINWSYFLFLPWNWSCEDFLASFPARKTFRRLVKVVYALLLCPRLIWNSQRTIFDTRLSWLFILIRFPIKSLSIRDRRRTSEREKSTWKLNFPFKRRWQTLFRASFRVCSQKTTFFSKSKRNHHQMGFSTVNGISWAFDKPKWVLCKLKVDEMLMSWKLLEILEIKSGLKTA